MSWFEFSVLAGVVLGGPILMGMAFSLGLIGRKRSPNALPHDRRMAAAAMVFFFVTLNAVPLLIFGLVGTLVRGGTGIVLTVSCFILYLLLGQKRIAPWAARRADTWFQSRRSVD